VYFAYRDKKVVSLCVFRARFTDPASSGPVAAFEFTEVQLTMP
jgi:hypothetical protein